MPAKVSLPPRSRADIAAQIAAQFRYAAFDQRDYLRGSWCGKRRDYTILAPMKIAS
jgi:hypothetical protein